VVASWTLKQSLQKLIARCTNGNAPISRAESITMTNKIETVSGVFFDIDDPKADLINITDIAWGLSRQARFAGHTITQIPYNVAHHSLYVCSLVESVVSGKDTVLSDLAVRYANAQSNSIAFHRSTFVGLNNENTLMHALLHDASEAYLMDVPSPVKRLPGFKDAYGAIESKLIDCIVRKFCSEGSHEIYTLIKWADLFSRSVEAYHFMPSRGKNWVGLSTPPLEYLHTFEQPMTSFEAYSAFLKKFDELAMF
jgi:hypothetical protein